MAQYCATKEPVLFSVGAEPQSINTEKYLIIFIVASERYARLYLPACD